MWPLSPAVRRPRRRRGRGALPGDLGAANPQADLHGVGIRRAPPPGPVRRGRTPRRAAGRAAGGRPCPALPGCWRAAKSQVQDDAVRAEMREWTRTISATDGVPLRSHGTSPFPVDGLLAHTLPADDGGAALGERGPRPGHGRCPAHRHGHAGGLGPGRARARERAPDEPQRPDWWRRSSTHPYGGDAARSSAHCSTRPDNLQAVLRIGEPLVTVPATPRRPLMEVLSGLTGPAPERGRQWWPKIGVAGDHRRRIAARAPKSLQPSSTAARLARARVDDLQRPIRDHRRSGEHPPA